jgi:hypothetical protein
LASVVSTGRAAGVTATAGYEASDRYAALFRPQLLGAALLRPQLLRSALFGAQRPQRELERQQEQFEQFALRRQQSPPVSQSVVPQSPGSQFSREPLFSPTLIFRPRSYKVSAPGCKFFLWGCRFRASLFVYKIEPPVTHVGA